MMNSESLKQRLCDAVLPNCKLDVSKLAIDKFAEKLSLDDLLTLANLVTSEETESALASSQCLFVEMGNKNQRLNINHRCYSPILCCIQMWRWGTFDKVRTLMHKGVEDPQPSRQRQLLCINPFHYESTEPEEINEQSAHSVLEAERATVAKPRCSGMQWWYEAPPEHFSKNKCRVCLSTDVLFDWRASVTDAEQWISHEVTYAECFYESTQLPDDMEEQLPQFLCCTCKKELTAAYVFICKARQADRMLRLKQEKAEETTANQFALEKIDVGFEWVAATDKTTSRENLPLQTDECDNIDFLIELGAKAADIDDAINDEDSLSNSSSSSAAAEADHADLKVADIEAPLVSLRSKTRRQARCVRTLTTDAAEKSSVGCEHCTAVFPKEWMLSRHIARCHKQSQYLCHACPRIFKDTNSLRQHTLTHEPNRTREFTCAVCHREFYTQGAFSTHAKTHDSNRKPLFACDACDKTFFHKGSLKLHQKLHTGEHVACQICDKRYLRRIDLEIHLRTHSGDMPYKCHHDDCEKAFNQVSLLNKHLRYHEGFRYKCDICDKEYNHQSTLIQHRKEHTGLPLKCAICGKGFVKRSKMRRHINGVHKVDDAAEMDKLIIRVKTERAYKGIQRNYTQTS